MTFTAKFPRFWDARDRHWAQMSRHHTDPAGNRQRFS
jgi:hypothetical protein